MRLLKKTCFLCLVMGVSVPAVVRAEALTPVLESAIAKLNALTASDFEWIGDKIYQNECASQPKYLTHWGTGETFPSFGIAHFIWFPKGESAPFDETFPEMVRFVSKRVPAPKWVVNHVDSGAPWQDKKQFDQAWSSDQLQQLRAWLLQTKPQQSQFIVLRLQGRWQARLAQLPRSQANELNRRIKRLLSFKKGVFAVVDYVNFKGLGHHDKERYQGQSWGLISVLESMQWPEAAEDSVYLERFVQSAKARLQLRVALSPSERQEQRWLKGWLKRLNGYY